MTNINPAKMLLLFMINLHDRPVNLGASSLKILLDKGLRVVEFQTI
jgi:hypothetical protein